eukprot:12934217-Prorocentrum_lima.AAC.1
MCISLLGTGDHDTNELEFPVALSVLVLTLSTDVPNLSDIPDGLPVPQPAACYQQRLQYVPSLIL